MAIASTLTTWRDGYDMTTGLDVPTLLGIAMFGVILLLILALAVPFLFNPPSKRERDWWETPTKIDSGTEEDS